MDIETRMSQVPRDETQYGYWEGDRGNSKYFFENKDKSNFHNRVEKIMNEHNATYVPYRNAQVDFDYFAVFTVDVKVASKRTVTHPNTNQKIAETIIKYKGNYEKMYEENIMGIASGSQRSQDMAKSIIQSVKNEAIDSSLSKELQIKLAIDELKNQKKLNKQTIHEENLVKGKELNKTQWVDTDINKQFGHLAGTSEAKRLENEKNSKEIVLVNQGDYPSI